MVDVSLNPSTIYYFYHLCLVCISDNGVWPKSHVECTDLLCIFLNSCEMVRYNWILSCVTEISLSDCGSLADPGDGSVSFTSTTYDSQAMYICKTGYSLVGSETRVCLANETWSETAPVCQIKGNMLDFVMINRQHVHQV